MVTGSYPLLQEKFLRINSDGTIPDDNPFDSSPIFSYGHRNPQGIAWSDEWFVCFI